MKNKLLFVSCIALITFILTPHASADDTAVINSNGSSSSNNLDTSVNNEVTSLQNNQANLTNNINTTANSGGNIVDSSTVDKANIISGSVSQISSIINNINQSTNITGNGFSSQNIAVDSLKNQTTITILQNASIVNNIKNTSNTGSNTADNNKGNLYISTGDIISSIKINNFVNLSSVSTPDNSNKNSNLKIENNSAETDNNERTLKVQSLKITTNQTADVENDVNSSTDTGNNRAMGNTGAVIINTGDIISSVAVQNEVNKNVFDQPCCFQNKAVQTSPTEQNNNPGPSSQPQSQPISSLPPLQPVPLPQPFIFHSLALSYMSPQVVHIAGMATRLLSVAGTNWLLFSIFANIIMCFFGAYLRLRSGNSPGLLPIS